jgi:hypothetical protein
VPRVLGGFAAEKRLGRPWTLGGIGLETLEAALGGVLLLSTEVGLDVLAPVAAPGDGQRRPAPGRGLRLRRLART